MSDLFYTGQSRRTSGALSVTMRDGAKLAKKLEKLKDGGETAIKRTVSDFTSRAPAWVSKGIRQHYGVDTAAIKEAGPKTKRGATSTNVSGISVDGASLEYKGETLTPIHFKMSPKAPRGLQDKRQRIPGQMVDFKGAAGPVGIVRTPKPYTVKATIIKGQRASMKAGTYLASSSKKNADAPTLPFQRTGEGRTPVEAVRTLSVPQMISGKAKETIEETIGSNLEKRFEHHVQQAMK